jgi:hypothetical protein
VRTSGEHEGVGGLEVGTQERPGLLDVAVDLVGAHVAPPQNRLPTGPTPIDQTRRLGVVKHHDITPSHQVGQRRRVRSRHALDDGMLGRAQRTTVAGDPVQPVVQSLRDREELPVAPDHQPPGIDAGAPSVGQQDLQHLGHAPSDRRRVDVPDGATGEQLPGAVSDGSQRPDPVPAHHRGEPIDRESTDLNLVKPSHTYLIASAPDRSRSRSPRPCSRVRPRGDLPSPALPGSGRRGRWACSLS